MEEAYLEITCGISNIDLTSSTIQFVLNSMPKETKNKLFSELAEEVRTQIEWAAIENGLAYAPNPFIQSGNTTENSASA